MSLQAYQTASNRSEDPRATEYRLFAHVTRGLMSAKETDKNNIQARMEALDLNRRMWSNFATDCASQENQLPDSLRASIISLSLFVSKHTTVAMRDPEAIDDLVDINRTIMQGLMPQASGAVAG